LWCPFVIEMLEVLAPRVFSSLEHLYFVSSWQFSKIMKLLIKPIYALFHLRQPQTFLISLFFITLLILEIFSSQNYTMLCMPFFIP
jgi:hypothetical protein